MTNKFSVFLDNNRSKECKNAAFVFNDPVDIIIANSVDEIQTSFENVRRALKQGKYVAGWMSYETGLLLEGKLKPLAHKAYKCPFLSFGVYDHKDVLSSEECQSYWEKNIDSQKYELSNLALNISQKQYEEAVSKIHSYLMAGDIYQVNFTLKALFDFSGKTESYFAAMRRAQKVEYGAFIKTDHLSVLSLSPELFFKKEGHKIITRPMKGTCSRGRTYEEDLLKASAMQHDEKSRAENLMIVDLIRNDLAKISSPSSVKLKSLYDIEKYRTLYQMTSTIEADVPNKTDITDVMRALFPCGSVTGAPKIRAMEIISELEKSPRGIYTGAIGYMAPEGDCCFSVPIRTVTINNDGKGEMGIGSAIIADSVAKDEYKECLLKAQFATKTFREFDLIESLRWEFKSKNSIKGEYFLLLAHLDRLERSAKYFDFDINRDDVLDQLNTHGDYLDQNKVWKVRVLLSSFGEISISSSPLENIEGDTNRNVEKVITLSKIPVNSHNPMLFHKTTDREFYDNELQKHQQEYGSYDVIFQNEKGYLSEGTFNNIFVMKNGIFYTPPLNDGVLKGTFRQSLMDDPTVTIQEKSLTVSDLVNAEKIYMGNSIRGLVNVSFIEKHP